MADEGDISRVPEDPRPADWLDLKKVLAVLTPHPPAMGERYPEADKGPAMRFIRLVLPALMLLAAFPAAAQATTRVWAIALPKGRRGVLHAFLNSDDLALGFMCTKKTTARLR